MSDRDGLIDKLAEPEWSSESVPPLREGLSPVMVMFPEKLMETVKLCDTDSEYDRVSDQSNDEVGDREC